MNGHVQDALPGMDPPPARLVELEPDSPPDPEVDERALIAAAITKAAAHRHNLVHIAAVRSHLPMRVRSSALGGTFNGLARRGVLVKTGRYEENGDNSPKARNASKASPVWKLMRAITPEDYR